MTDYDTINLANERMSIIDACNEVGMELSGYYNGKLFCPFGQLWHADGGLSKSFRVYDDSAFCFAGCGFFNPVKLIAKDRDLTDIAAAEYILDKTGYIPPDLDSQWAAVTATEEKVSTDDLAEALKMFCRRISPDWDVRQFDPTTATTLRKCLELTAQIHTPDEATQWLAVTKQVMANELGETHVSSV